MCWNACRPNPGDLGPNSANFGQASTWARKDCRTRKIISQHGGLVLERRAPCSATFGKLDALCHNRLVQSCRHHKSRVRRAAGGDAALQSGCNTLMFVPGTHEASVLLRFQKPRAPGGASGRGESEAGSLHARCPGVGVVAGMVPMSRMPTGWVMGWKPLELERRLEEPPCGLEQLFPSLFLGVGRSSMA